MHYANRLFWRRTATRYPRWFASPSRVLECGSFSVNGSIRDHFTATDYVGLDWRPGPCVDLVSLTHEAPFGPASFDTIASASMLEHDPYWRESLGKMYAMLKPDGLMALSWGAMRNNPHEFATAPDGLFHALAAGKVIDALRTLGLHIQEFEYERNILRAAGEDNGSGEGEVVLVGFKDASLIREPATLDPLFPEDNLTDPSAIARRFRPDFYVLGYGTDSEPRSTDWMASLVAPMGERFRDGVRVLDYGCGGGRLFNFMTGLLADFHYYGAEPEGGKELDVARSFFGGHPKATFLTCEEAVARLDEIRPDAVILGSIFTHLMPDHCERILDSLMPVVERGGSIIFTTFVEPELSHSGPGAHGFADCYAIVRHSEEWIARLRTRYGARDAGYFDCNPNLRQWVFEIS